MAEQHHFDIDLACKYGILEAILINHFQFWLKTNKANKKNYHEGRYWTFNSAKAFAELFPYVSERKIRNALKHLQDENIIITGNFNKSSYDRTLWYAFTDYAISILQNRQMEKAEKENGNGEIVEPIPDNNTDNNPVENTDDIICAEPQSSSTPTAVMQLLTNKKSELFDITQQHIDDFKRWYPSVDIMQELNKIQAWLVSNPAKRKTKRGMMSFVNRWLSKEQDRPHGNYNTTYPKPQDTYNPDAYKDTGGFDSL